MTKKKVPALASERTRQTPRRKGWLVEPEGHLAGAHPEVRHNARCISEGAPGSNSLLDPKYAVHDLPLGLDPTVMGS